MGWGIIIKEDLYLSKVKIEDLPDVKEGLEESIRQSIQKMMMLAAATPRDTEDDLGGKIPWEDHVHFEMIQLLEDYNESLIQLSKVNFALDNLDKCEEV